MSVCYMQNDCLISRFVMDKSATIVHGSAISPKKVIQILCLTFASRYFTSSRGCRTPVGLTCNVSFFHEICKNIFKYHNDILTGGFVSKLI